MKFSKKNISKFLVGIAALAAIFSACKKDKGAYDFVNEVNSFDGNVYQYLQNQNQFDSLLKAVDRVSAVKAALTNDRNITIFALTNRNFDVALSSLNKVRLSQNKPTLGIATIDPDELGILLDRYIISRKLTTDSLKFADGAFLRTAILDYEMNAVDKSSNASGLVNGGPKSIIYSDTQNSQYTKDWRSTTTQSVNIFTKNAIVHVIAASHEFGFGEFVNRMNK